MGYKSLHYLILVLTSLLLWGFSLFIGFLSDDWVSLYQATHNGTLWTSLMRPGALLIDKIQLGLFNYHAPLYHAYNIAIHTLNGLLVYWITMRFCHRYDKVGVHNETQLALLASIIFLILPNRFEPIVWISGKAALTSTCFCLIALLFWLKHGNRALVIGYVAYLVGLLIYPLGLLLPLVGFILPRTPTHNKMVHLLISSLVVTASIAFISSEVLFGYISLHAYKGIEVWITNTGRFSLRLLSPPVSQWVMIIGTLPITIIAGYQMITRRLIAPLPFFAVALILLLPFIPLQVSFWYSISERLLYLASFPFAIGFAVALQRVEWKLLSLALAMMMITAFTGYVPWYRAQHITKDTKDFFGQYHKPTPVYIPDNVSGAYVFRNGWNAAFAHWGYVAPMIKGSYEISNPDYPLKTKLTGQIPTDRNKFEYLWWDPSTMAWTESGVRSNSNH